jgi:hypothetical protein
MKKEEPKLRNGTLIRHRDSGYEGTIDGITEIKACFTSGGEPAAKARESFQYRIAVPQEVMRRIAPAEDLEVIEEVVEVVCPACRFAFRTRPGFPGKPGGRCSCGATICPYCLACEATDSPLCAQAKKRLARRRPARGEPASSR